jgi:hypothetical protein
MQDDQDKLHGDEEEVFGATALADDVIDEFDDGDHPLEDDELAASPHDTDEDADIFDFFGDEDEKNDGMY